MYGRMPPGEVNKVRRRERPGRFFIRGIYNYCDRWCERCRATKYCMVFEEDEARLRKHEAEGTDPYDWSVVMQDVAENLKEALELLQEWAEEAGVDLSEPSSVLEDTLDEEAREHLLCRTAEQYLDGSRGFLDKLRRILEAEGVDLQERAEFLPSDEDLDALARMHDCYETITWYHMQIAVKIRRSISSLLDSRLSDLQELADRDAVGSAKVAYEGVCRSMAALERVCKWDRSLMDDAIPLLALLSRLREGIDSELPQHQEFIRPGLDTDPEEALALQREEDAQLARPERVKEEQR